MPGRLIEHFSPSEQSPHARGIACEDAIDLDGPRQLGIVEPPTDPDCCRSVMAAARVGPTRTGGTSDGTISAVRRADQTNQRLASAVDDRTGAGFDRSRSFDRFRVPSHGAVHSGRSISGARPGSGFGADRHGAPGGSIVTVEVDRTTSMRLDLVAFDAGVASTRNRRPGGPLSPAGSRGKKRWIARKPAIVDAPTDRDGCRSMMKAARS